MSLPSRSMLSAPSLLSDSPIANFQRDFDSVPFAFEHRFNSPHPFFQASRLRKLMENPATRAGIYYEAGDIRVDQRWDAVPPRRHTIEEIFDAIESAGAWMIFRRVHLDPDYGDILNECMRDLKMLSGKRIDEDRKSQEAMIFVTSPRRVTSCHIDRECNFLMQVKGSKTIHVFPRDDRDVIPEEELETFWSRDNNAGVCKPELQGRARIFPMEPGKGVHIPVNCPHWLQNGDNVSISLSTSYRYKDSNRKYVYQANYYLRKLGMHPSPPGRYPILDHSKNLAMAAGIRAQKLLARH